MNQDIILEKYSDWFETGSVLEAGSYDSPFILEPYFRVITVINMQEEEVMSTLLHIYGICHRGCDNVWLFILLSLVWG